MKLFFAFLGLLVCFLANEKCLGNGGSELFSLIEEANANDAKMLNNRQLKKDESRTGWNKVKEFLQSKNLQELLDISRQVSVKAAERPHLNNDWEKGASASSYVATALSPLVSRELDINEFELIFTEIAAYDKHTYWLEGMSGWLRNLVLKGKLSESTKAAILPPLYDLFKSIITTNSNLSQRQKEAFMVAWLDILSKTFIKASRPTIVQELLKTKPDNLQKALGDLKDKIDNDSLAILLADSVNASTALDTLINHFCNENTIKGSLVLKERARVILHSSLIEEGNINKYDVLLQNEK